MKLKKNRKQKKARSVECLAAILHHGAGKHSDKRDRRGKRDNEWKTEVW